MSLKADDQRYIDVDELSARTGLSLATIHRLKRAEKIPFYQPAGKGGRLLFPQDAIERAGQATSNVTGDVPEANAMPLHLSGRTPAWMTQTTEPR